MKQHEDLFGIEVTGGGGSAAPDSGRPTERQSTRRSTSDEAHRSADVAATRKVMLDLISQRPRTCDEIVALGFAHQSASAAINWLMRQGHIVPSGEKRRTRMGRRAIVWRHEENPQPLVRTRPTRRELERELAQRDAERDALAAEIAALKAQSDPINDASEEACGDPPCEGEAMSDTPRTDARVFSVGVEVRGHDGEPQTEYVDVVYEGFAQELERDLAQRTAERDEAWLTNATLRADLARANAERDDLAAEIAALKAQPDPLAEMWAALDEYQPMADRDGHGKSWRRMCRERTVNAAWDAYHSSPSNKSSGLWSSRAAADAARAANFGNHAKDVIALIRRAKEVQR